MTFVSSILASNARTAIAKPLRPMGALVLALSGALCCWPPTLAEMESTLPFCAEAQQVLAGTALVARVILHEDYASFVESKPTDTPFVVHQYFSNPAPDDAHMMRTVSCKMRTAERINLAHAEFSRGPVAAGDRDCAEVHRWLLASLLAEIPPHEVRLDPARIFVEPQQSTFMGPTWLEPWPFQAASIDQNGDLRLHSRALHVPRAWWIPLPERFQGNYYCHLVAPDFLRAILLGKTGP